MKSKSFLFTALLACALVLSCTPKFTMHHKRLKADERNHNAHNLARLQSAAKNSENGASFKIAIITDTHSDYDDLEKTIELLNARNDLDFVLVTGDVTNIGMVWEYRQTLNLFKRIHKPVVTVMGNHDALSHGKEIFQDMFGAHEFGFTHKGVRFVVWNGSKLEFNRKNQDFSFIKSELKNKDKYSQVVLVSHLPPMEGEESVLSPAERDELHGILKSGGVKLGLHGHLHEFRRHKFDSVEHIVAQRVRDVHYNVVTLSDAGHVFEVCKKSGCEVKEK